MKTLRPVLGALILILIAGSAQAQQLKMSAAVPFPFVVGDRIYPAGEYYFSRASITNNFIQVADSERIVAANLLSQACVQLTPPQDTQLVFHRMGDTYFLSQMWVAGNQWGRELPRSQTETRLAENHNGVETIIVAANLIH